MKKCISCKKEFEPANANQKHCSKNCGRKFNRKRNHKKYKETDRKYYEKNIKRIRKNVKKHYDKNKEKINSKKSKRLKEDKEYARKAMSRNETRQVLMLNERLRKKIVEIPMNCKDCGAIENLELHHEIYPIGREAIRKTLKGGKIYYLCRKCHGRRMRIKI